MSGQNHTGIISWEVTTSPAGGGRDKGRKQQGLTPPGMQNVIPPSIGSESRRVGKKIGDGHAHPCHSQSTLLCRQRRGFSVLWEHRELGSCLGRSTVRDSQAPPSMGTPFWVQGSAGVALGKGAEEMGDPPETLAKFLNPSHLNSLPHARKTDTIVSET